MKLTNLSPEVGDIWERAGGPTCKWLRAVRVGDALSSDCLLVDGARLDDFGVSLPDVFYRLSSGTFVAWPGKDVRVVRDGVIIQEIEAVIPAAADVEREDSPDALDEMLGNWLPGVIVVLFVFAFVVGMAG